MKILPLDKLMVLGLPVRSHFDAETFSFADVGEAGEECSTKPNEDSGKHDEFCCSKRGILH